MFKDSDSLRSDYNSLCSWLNLPETQEVLEQLQLEANQLKALQNEITPSRDIGTFVGNFFHREQTFGEVRGLQRLRSLLLDRKQELESKLDPKPIEIQPLD